MVVRLDEEMAEFVRGLVSGGRFESEDAVVAAALRQMRDRSAKKAEIRRIMLEEASKDPKQLIG